MSTKQITSFTAENQDLATYVITVRTFLKYCFSVKVPNIQRYKGFHILLHFHSPWTEQCINCKQFICNCQANEQ